ncbi:spermatogenesis-associated protein 2 [Colossoma macropomum]|uniref:spermatogenesis-associated protein 2 n=1 Tax=Colossoma macropomum TaxID=42526 RepID=UPI001864492C|nr:spermatogenesis-associated protein 2 [Colossoma macropomum]XP_036447282.1 spermatogenesis-associated protein 2 [Colossoma macropomum]
MDAKLREDLFRRYVASLEKRLEEGAGGEIGGGGGGGGQGTTSEEALISTATALLGAYQPDPGHRFRMIRFYDIVENSLRTLRGANLRTLETAFATLETVCTNLLLFPWKKEFRCIKTFTGPYVYHLQSAICDADLRALLRSMGYSRDQELQYIVREHPGGSAHLRQLAFELLLAQAECRLLGEVVALSRGTASELEAVEVRRNTREDAAGCADALRRRDSLTGDMTRLSVRPADIERAHLRRSGRPSKSVDVTDSAGHWHQASKPILKASLSLRKEPLFVDTEEDLKDEIIRPGTSLHPAAALPSHSPVADFFPIQSPPSEPYPYHLSSLDEIDLYTERGLGGRQTPSRPPSREARDGWAIKSHGVKCQGCGLGCPTLSSCQRCDMILCPSCHAVEPTPCCGFQDYPKTSRPLDGYMPVKEKLSVYSSSAHSHTHPHPHPHPLPHSHSHSPLLDKPMISTKLFPSKPLTLSAPSPTGGERLNSSGSRCGFCNKPGASHTCINCSKVSCDSCMSLYASDMCTRKSLHHSFVPNHQLNYKSSTISHLVYR